MGKPLGQATGNSKHSEPSKGGLNALPLSAFAHRIKIDRQNKQVIFMCFDYQHRPFYSFHSYREKGKSEADGRASFRPSAKIGSITWKLRV